MVAGSRYDEMSVQMVSIIMQGKTDLILACKYLCNIGGKGKNQLDVLVIIKCDIKMLHLFFYVLFF